MTTELAILVLACSAWINRAQDQRLRFLIVQNRVLRETRADPRSMTKEHRRALGEAAQGLTEQELRDCDPLVTPETLRRYYRDLVVAKWTQPRGTSAGRSPGRPAIAPEVVAAVLRLARESPSLGAPGIAHRLTAIGHKISRSSVASILTAHGVDPAPRRQKEQDWATFLEHHAEQIAAIDATAVECLEGDRLVTRWVVMAIHHDTRKVHLVGIIDHLSQEWMVQQARNLTDPDHGFLQGRKYLLMDRDPSFSVRFRETLQAAGVEAVQTPPRSPNCNPFIERFFRSLKEECLSSTIPLGQAGLRHLVTEYLAYYHQERPHDGLGGGFIIPDERISWRTGEIVTRRRLGGLLKFYHRLAA